MTLVTVSLRLGGLGFFSGRVPATRTRSFISTGSPPLSVPAPLAALSRRCRPGQPGTPSQPLQLKYDGDIGQNDMTSVQSD